MENFLQCLSTECAWREIMYRWSGSCAVLDELADCFKKLQLSIITSCVQKSKMCLDGCSDFSKFSSCRKHSGYSVWMSSIGKDRNTVPGWMLSDKTYEDCWIISTDSSKAESTRCGICIRDALCVMIRASCVWKNVSNLSRCVICSFVTSDSPTWR